MTPTHGELFQAIKDAKVGTPAYEAALAAYDGYMFDQIGDWDYLTFPVAWAIQRKYGDGLQHHERCSSVEGWDPISGPGLLCDCGAVRSKWQELHRIVAAS